MGQRRSQEPVVRAVYVVGPSSSGKTTLCNALASRLDIGPPAFIKEVARTVMKDNGFTRDDVGRMEMQYAILKAHAEADMEARDSVARGDASVVLSDRSVVDPIVYALLSSQIDGQKRTRTLIASTEIQRSLPQLRCSVVVLLTPVPEWVQDDGVRSVDEGFSADAFRTVLKQLRIPFHEIDGPSCRNLEDRVQRVLSLAGLSLPYHEVMESTSALDSSST